MVRTDSLLHIMASALIVIFLASSLPLWAAILATAAIGGGKELWDKTHDGCCSWHDIMCDLCGISLGLVIYLLNTL